MARRRYPVLGDLPAYRRDPLALLSEAAAAPGDVAELRIGRRTLLVKRPEDAGHVLAGNHANYEKTPRLTGARGRRIAGEGVFTRRNGDALAHRRPVQPLFGRRALERLEPAVLGCVDDLLARWRPGTSVDLGAEMARLARAVAFSVVCGSAPGTALGEGFALRRARLNRHMGSPVQLPGLVPLAFAPRGRRTLAAWDRALLDAIRARRAEPRDDLISELVLAGLDDERVTAEAMSLSISGVDAVTRGMAATLAELARHPRTAERVRDEARSAAPPSRAELPYTELVAMEALRVRPPTTYIVRVAQGPDRLPSGTAVARGTKVLVSPFVLHRDPSLHPRPERFDPERFGDEARGTRSRFAYIPFGAGPRTCIGRNLAMLEIVLVTARVAERFDLAPAGGRDGLEVRVDAAPAPPARAYTRVP